MKFALLLLLFLFWLFLLLVCLLKWDPLGLLCKASQDNGILSWRYTNKLMFFLSLKLFLIKCIRLFGLSLRIS